MAPSVSQIRRPHTWESNGKFYSVWDASITTTSFHIASVNIGFHLPGDAEIVDLWELTPTSYQSLGIAGNF